DGFDALSVRSTDREWESQATARFAQLADRYIAQLQPLASAPTEALVVERDALRKRLERGWLMEPSERVTEEKIAEQFSVVLARYEAACDALAGFPAVEQRLRAQLAFIQDQQRQARRKGA